MVVVIVNIFVIEIVIVIDIITIIIMIFMKRMWNIILINLL